MTDRVSTAAAEQDVLTPGGFSALLGAAADAIIIIDESGIILNFNRAAERLFGFTASEAVNRNVSFLMPDPYRSEHDHYLREYVDTGRARIIGVGRKVEAKKKDGSIFPAELSVGEYRSGDLRYFVGIMRDLSDRERTETELRESRARLAEREKALEVTIKSAPIGIATLDPDGHVLSLNPAACELIGYSESDLRGRPYTSTIHVEDIPTVETRIRTLVEENSQSFTQNVRHLDRAGNLVHVVLHCAPVRDPSERIESLVAQLVDRTEQVRAAQEAREARERLAHVDRISTMGEMASSIAHEINQPLTAIGSYIQAGLRRLDSGNIDMDKLRELLVKTGEQSRRAGTIVKRIRSLIRSHDRVRERLAVNKVIQHTLPLARADARSRGVVIDVELMHNSLEIIADEVQIQQVILNLVINAIDAMEGEGSNNGRIELGSRLADMKDFVEIWVRDHGPGVPEGIHDQVFEPFVTTKTKGTGMGLSISRSIVRAHGGDIWCESANPGTTFRFTLPLSVGENDDTT